MYAIYDNQAIWGTGETEEAAWQDVGQWVNEEDFAKCRETMKCAPMTKWLARRVEKFGGDVSTHEFFGTLMTYGAWDRADRMYKSSKA